MPEEKFNWHEFDGMSWDDIPKQKLHPGAGYGLYAFKLLPNGPIVNVGFNYDKCEGFVFEMFTADRFGTKCGRIVAELFSRGKKFWVYHALDDFP